MGKVATLFNVYSNPDKEEQVVRDIKEKLKPNSLQLEDVAFGIKIIKVMFIHDDKDGSEGYEKKLRAIPNTNDVEVSEESLIS